MLTTILQSDSKPAESQSNEFINKYISSSSFTYNELTSFDHRKLNTYIQNTHLKYTNEAKEWNIEKNNFWILRLYASLKMLLSSTLFYSNYEFSKEKKIYIALPYFEYYGLVSSCRALLLLSSDKDVFSTIFSATHRDIIKSTTQLLTSIDTKLSEEFNQHINSLKDRRERFSYHIPTKKIITDDVDITYESSLNYSRLLAEMAQLNSEVLQKTVTTDKNREHFIFGNVQEIDDEIFKYFDSDEDYYRLGYIARKVKKPISIHQLATEGLTEDFLGNYMEEYAEENNLSPLHNLQLIFPFD